MNHEGPWSWRSTRQGQPVQSDDERAYAERVRENKKLKTDRARTKRETEQKRAARERNNRPIF